MPDEMTMDPAKGARVSLLKKPLSRGFILIYGTGQAIDLLINNVVGIVIMVYLTSVGDLDPGVAGLVLLISMGIDAFLDPYIGAASDGWSSKMGHRHPFMFLGLVLLPLAIVGLFSIPPGMSEVARFVYLLFFCVLMRVSSSLFLLPYAALLAEFSTDYVERSRMMLSRLVFALTGWGGALWFSFGSFFGGENALSEPTAYVMFGLLVSLLVIVFGGVAAFGTLSMARQLQRPIETTSPTSRFFHEVGQLFKNPSFVTLFLGILLYMTASGYLNSINLHTYRYFWGLTPEQMKLPTVAQPFGMLLSVPIAIVLMKRVEKRTLLLISVGLLFLTYSLPATLVNVGAIAAQGGLAVTIVVVSGIVYGLGSGLSFMGSGSMVADASDEHDLLFGVRREALYFAALLVSGKAALGLGGMLAGLGLLAISFPNDPASVAGAAQMTPNVIGALGVLWGPGFAAIILMSAPFFYAYKLDRQKHQQVLLEIEARNARLNAQS